MAELAEVAGVKSFPIIGWICRLGIAVILLQTLFFKFTGSAESVYIFRTVGMEPWGRFASGMVELLASILLFVPRWTWLGALLAFGVTFGAIGAHLTLLGIEVMGDRGLLFGLAIVVVVLSLIVLYLYRRQLPFGVGRW